MHLLFVALLVALIAIQALRTWPRAPAAPLCSPSRTLLGVVAAARYARGSGLHSFVTVPLQVAQLAAEGLSNREIGQKLFVSPRTVSTHL